MNLLDETDALDAIRVLLAKTDKARLAVAFWGRGAITRLGLDRPGLSLEILCNLDSGACNPAELRKLLGKPGVVLRSHPALHAKVYWTPNGAVLGSSNASINGLALETETASGWHEANVELVDPNILGDIDLWFTRLSGAGYPITSEDLDHAEHIWKSRVRQAPTGRRLPTSLFGAWRSKPDHPAWKYVKVVWWRDDLDADAHARLEIENKRLGGNFSAYEGWGDLISKGDVLIDFDCSRQALAFTGIWQALSGGRDGQLQLVSKLQGINIPGMGKFELLPDECDALAKVATAGIERNSDGRRNGIASLAQAMALVTANANL